MTTNVGGFYEFLPTGYNGTTQFPCLIWFHGAGVRGNGNSDLDNILAFDVPKWIGTRMGGANEFPYPMIVICPQYGTGVYPSAFLYQGVIDYVQANYAVDTNRIYLAGWSMGAVFMEEWGTGGNLNEIAALSPLAGAAYYNATAAAAYKAVNMPMWFLHGTADSVIEVERSEGWVDGLNSGTPLSPAPRLTLDPDTASAPNEHNISDHVTDWLAFSESGQTWYQWLLAQSRGVLSHELLYQSSGTLYKLLLYNDNTWKQQQFISGAWTDVTKQTYNIRWKVGSTLYRAALTPTTYSML